MSEFSLVRILDYKCRFLVIRPNDLMECSVLVSTEHGRKNYRDQQSLVKQSHQLAKDRDEIIMLSDSRDCPTQTGWVTVFDIAVCPEQRM